MSAFATVCARSRQSMHRTAFTSGTHHRLGLRLGARMRIVPSAPARICSTALRSAKTNPVNEFMKENAMFCGVAVACTKACAADLITQTAAEGRTWSEVNWRRVGLFFAWGFLYQGVATYYMYVKGFPLLFPGVAKFCNLPFREKLKDKAGLITLSKQVFLDIGVINPVLFWPVYYGFKEYFFRPEDDTRGYGQLISDTFEKYKKTFWEDNLGMAALWIPANYVIYALPLHLRLPVNHSVCFVWVGIVSFFRGADDNDNSNSNSIEIIADKKWPSKEPIALCRREPAP